MTSGGFPQKTVDDVDVLRVSRVAEACRVAPTEGWDRARPPRPGRSKTASPSARIAHCRLRASPKVDGHGAAIQRFARRGFRAHPSRPAESAAHGPTPPSANTCPSPVSAETRSVPHAVRHTSRPGPQRVFAEDACSRRTRRETRVAGGGARGARPTRPAASGDRSKPEPEGAMDCRAGSVYLRSGASASARNPSGWRRGFRAARPRRPRAAWPCPGATRYSDRDG